MEKLFAVVTGKNQGAKQSYLRKTKQNKTTQVCTCVESQPRNRRADVCSPLGDGGRCFYIPVACLCAQIFQREPEDQQQRLLVTKPPPATAAARGCSERQLSFLGSQMLLSSPSACRGLSGCLRMCGSAHEDVSREERAGVGRRDLAISREVTTGLGTRWT